MKVLNVAINRPLSELFSYQIPPSIELKAFSLGQRLLVPFGTREIIAILIAIEELDEAELEFELKPIVKILDAEPLVSKAQIALAERLAAYYFASLGEVLFAMLPFAKIEKEAATLLVPTNPIAQVGATLTADQQKALQTLKLTPQRYSYLFGVTGSGKTEVFIKLIEFYLSRGQTVIYLVPEISLSYQIYNRLKTEFPKIALVSSAQTTNQRFKDWLAMKNGLIDVVVGTRSAVFSPLKNLGLIIIDEEHDSSYKSQKTPRYHARQVAMLRAHEEKIQIVMGSATPSLEAYEAMKQGIFEEVKLTKRANQGSRHTPIQLIDMRKKASLLSAELIDEIIKTKKMGLQTLLYINRRGYAHYYSCPDCGFELMCKQCSVSLTYHKKEEKLICHYCGYQQNPPVFCPECKSLNAGYNAYGIERIEQEIDQIFSDYKILRLDSSTARNKKTAQAIIDEFREGKADILIGTQMVAKGFNFPKLRLVGIPCADIGLSLPDFRSEERVFALIYQIAGRTGRFNHEGLVVAQSYQLHRSAFQYVKNYAIEEFYEKELKERKITGFPPFSRLIKLVFRSKNEAKAIDESEKFSKEFEQFIENQAITLLGPSEAPIKKQGGSYRYQLLLKANSYGQLQQILATFLKSYRRSSAVYYEIEVDPLSLL